MTMVSGGELPGERPGGESKLRSSKPHLVGLDVWGATDVGRERAVNEDAIYPDPASGQRFYVPTAEEVARKGQLLLVADGIGGEQVGSAASQWAIRLTAERYYALPGDDLTMNLREALENTNAALHRYLRSTRVTQAGSTLAAAVIHEGLLYLANVGDSRVYLMRNGALYQQTRDHTLAQQKVERGELAQSAAASDPDSSVLTRALGATASVVVDVFRPLPLASGDMVILCSDGLYETVPDAEMARVALSSAPRRFVERMIEAANAQGGYDNISVIIARVGGALAQTATTPGYLTTLKEDLAQLGLSQRRTLLIVLAVVALLIFAVMAIIGWRLHAPEIAGHLSWALALAMSFQGHRGGRDG